MALRVSSDMALRVGDARPRPQGPSSRFWGGASARPTPGHEHTGITGTDVSPFATGVLRSSSGPGNREPVATWAWIVTDSPGASWVVRPTTARPSWTCEVTPGSWPSTCTSPTDGRVEDVQ